MTKFLQLDAQDKAALAALDDFTFNADDEVATIEGVMEVTVVRPAHDGGDQLWLTIRFTGGEELFVKLRRSQLLRELGVEADKS